MSDERSLPIMDQLPVDLARDDFMRTLLRELAGTLQDVVGLDQASGFVSVVGQRMGDRINLKYTSAAGIDKFDVGQVADILVDMKQRIQGDFYVISMDDEKIVLGNRACPFGDEVIDRPALCMMTSNVFGSIASQNLGYAKVSIEESIARGDQRCLVVVYLKPTSDAVAAEGREYFGDDESASKTS